MLLVTCELLGLEEEEEEAGAEEKETEEEKEKERKEKERKDKERGKMEQQLKITWEFDLENIPIVPIDHYHLHHRGIVDCQWKIPLSQLFGMADDNGVMDVVT
jgi:hypothetical protein